MSTEIGMTKINEDGNAIFILRQGDIPNAITSLLKPIHRKMLADAKLWITTKVHAISGGKKIRLGPKGHDLSSGSSDLIKPFSNLSNHVCFMIALSFNNMLAYGVVFFFLFFFWYPARFLTCPVVVHCQLLEDWVLLVALFLSYGIYNLFDFGGAGRRRAVRANNKKVNGWSKRLKGGIMQSVSVSRFFFIYM